MNNLSRLQLPACSPIAWRAGLLLLAVLLAGACLTLLFLSLTPLAPPRPAHADDAAFDERRKFGDSTDSTQSIVLGDMDNDGDLDLIVGNDQTQSAVYLNDGAGSFDWPGSARNFGGATDSTNSVAVGDVDSDGDLDIVAANSGPDVIYFNDGATNFIITQTFGTGGASAVAVGDLNGDGEVDIAGVGVPNVAYLNDGAGSFPVTRTFGSGMNAITLGDMDNDGDLDLVTGDVRVCLFICSGGQDIVYLNDGAANFGATRNFGASTDSTYSVAVGDMNGDGALDIVSGNGLLEGGALCLTACGQPNVVYLNDGTGVFPNASPYTRTFGTGSDNTRSVAVGDVDGDGDLDIVTGNQSAGGYDYRGWDLVYLNAGNANFYSGAAACGTAANAICFGEVEETNAVVAGDLNGDSALDFVAGYDGAQSYAYLNDGAAQFSVAIGFGAGEDFALTVAVGDLDADGDLDLAVSDEYGADAVYLNDGLGRFPVSRAANVTRFWADLTGDGALDIVGSTLYVNDGAANFPTTRTIGINVTGVGDLNGDGALDVFGNGVARINDGLGNFTNTSPYTRTFGAGRNVAGDVDRDGDLDLLTLIGFSGTVHLNDGAGYFDWPGGILTFETIWDNIADLELGDMNGDGYLDLVTATSNQPHVLYLNDGRGHFSWPGSARTFGDFWHETDDMVLGDLDGDGDLDIVVGNSGGWDPNNGYAGCYVGGQSAFYLNDGLGNFDWDGSAHDFGGASEATRSVALGDTDGDGDLDIIAGHTSTDPACPTQGGQNTVYRNGLVRSIRLPNNPPRAALIRPNPLINLNFVYTDPALRTLIVPITYTLADPESDPVRLVRASYSPDGGGNWYTAVATDGMPTSNLATPFLGYGMFFGGVATDYVSISSFSAFPTTAATVEFWMKSSDTAKQGTPVSYASSGYTNSLTLIDYRNFDIYIKDQFALNTGISANDGQWHHIAVTWRSSTGQTILYKDGLPVYTTTLAGGQALSSGGTLVFGQDQDTIGGGFTSAQAFAGVLDEVRLWNTARTQAQIQANKNAILTGAQAGLVGYWRFSEGRGSRVNNVASTSNDGTRFGGADWTLAAQSHVYNWDITASGFFGQSDNVVFRIEAYPSFNPAANSMPLYQRPYASAQTFPFRVRGTQVRVISGTVPVRNALVYHLPAARNVGALPLADGAGLPYRTDALGYLQGRGAINPGDRLVALLPITTTQSYTLYYTNATPNVVSMTMYTVGTQGVQTLTVSASRPLILFNLDASLEWDARKDAQYLELLEFNFQRASEILFDATDGQAALGDVRIFHAKQNWDNAHIRIYANNRLRPFASIGGVVSTPITDPVTSTVVYLPGQLHMAPTWNRYGNPGVSLGEDWPRTLAHELGHYLLFQDDDYLGLDASGKLMALTTCTGTLMSDPYREDYSELRPAAGWDAACGSTLANRSTGRSDWETADTFYPWLNTPGATNNGPTGLPLAVTQISFVAPTSPSVVLDDHHFYLFYGGGSYQPDRRARAFLFKANDLVDLGGPVVDQALARGAEPGDKVCIFEPTAGRQGCKVITANDNQELVMTSMTNWQPDVIITPITSRTVNIQVSNIPTTGLALKGRLYGDTGLVSSAQNLSLSSGVYTTTFTFTNAVLGGLAHIWVDNDTGDNKRAVVTDYVLGGNPVEKKDGFVEKKDGFVEKKDGFAPVLSSDGQVVVYAPGLTFPVGTFYAVQAATYLPDVPAWATVLGKGYRLLASAGAPSLTGASLSMSYAESDVPANGEAGLRVYRYNSGTRTWQPLISAVNVDDNSVVAQATGPGLYALMTSLEIQLYGPGWDAFAYPVQVSQTVTQALQSIAAYYTTLYWYNGADGSDPWKVFDKAVPPYVIDFHDLRFGESYWIRLTQSVVLRLNGAPGEGALAPLATPEADSSFQQPPATYYGAVLASGGFTSAAGLTVIAYVEDVPCGQGQTLEYDGQIVYSVNVSADGPGAEGCGAPGRVVRFTVGGQVMAEALAWDNDRPAEVSLGAPAQLYLPLIRR